MSFLGLAVLLDVGSAAFYEDLVGGIFIEEGGYNDGFSFEFGVVFEEVSELVEEGFRDVLYVVYMECTVVFEGYGEEFVVGYVVVEHAHDTY